MYMFKRFFVATALSLASLAAPAQDPAGPDEKSERLREEIRERKEEIRDDRRELRQLERARRQRMRPGPVWVNLGLNASHVDQAADNGLGGQGGISFGRKLIVRVQHSEITYDSYEADYDFPELFSRQKVHDTSVLAGFVLGRSGFFLAGGPSLVDVERTSPGPWGGDTGTRYELGWNSRQALNAPVGFELVLFKNENDIRDFHGVALNLVFGPRVDGPQPRAGKRGA